MTENRDTPQGLAYALAAYGLWGFLPLYMKLLDHVPPSEVVAHRIVWSLPIAGGLLVGLSMKSAIEYSFLLGVLTLTAFLLSLPDPNARGRRVPRGSAPRSDRRLCKQHDASRVKHNT